MTLKQYNWTNGPDLIQQHSVAKHRILEAYLAAYFRTLVSSPNQDVLRLTLVDGFAGGGLYVHNDTREPVKGSPFIFLEATREAEFLINKCAFQPIVDGRFSRSWTAFQTNVDAASDHRGRRFNVIVDDPASRG